ncbi:MAG: SMC family ATPase [Bacteroidales bacterium]|nr:SMC family ATPase [Bacteroidales bacterium]
MRFKQLYIKNIGSIESKTIDFTANPLGNASLFLISGPTGSGKSIILDAVCLALYGKAVRLEKVSNRENYMDPQFNCNADGSISLSDPRQLVRRGTTSACAELVFEGNDGREYTASWNAMRGRRENINTRLTASRHIKSADGSVDCNREAECNNCIASANVVGLKFDEFCRTTLLAQGEFTKFLDSDTKEKADILEKVTGTEKFSKIGERINEKFKTIQESAKGLLDDINDKEKRPMEDGDRKALVDEDSELDDSRNTLVATKALAVGKKGILDRMAVNDANDAKADENLGKAAAQKATEEYKNAVRASSDWKASLEARGSLKARDEAKEIMDKALRKRAEMGKVYASLAGNLIWLEDSLGQFSGLGKEISDTEGKLKKARENHAKLNPDALAEEGKKLGGEKAVLEQILKQAQVWLTGKRIIIPQEIIEAFTPEQSDLYVASLSASRSLWDARNKQEEAQDKYDKVFAGFQDHAAAVRATLKEGDTCPVCGNVVKQILTDETIASILKPYKDGIEKAKSTVDAAKKGCDDVIVTITNASTAKDGQISAWQGRNAEVIESSNKISSLATRLSTLTRMSSEKASIEGTIRRITDVKDKVKSALIVKEPASPVKVENKKLESQWGDLYSEVERNAAEYDTAEKKWEIKKTAVEDFLAANPAFTEDYLVKLTAFSMGDINELDRKIKQVDDMETRAKAQKEACKKESERIATTIAEKEYVFAEGETSEALGQSIETIDTAISGIDTRKGEIKKALEVDDGKIESMNKTREDYEKIRPTLTNYETLNSLFGQGGGTLFKKIAQSHLLGVLLENANFYLSQFTDRYELMRQEGSLVVLMKDKQQDEAPRPANTLSGGEGFMASLALALGLSSFNSSDFSSDTIFIDEGFGTLSPKCLEGVYETLASLKKVVGKKVGIISHVEYLKDNIHPQILVEPIGNGLSEIKDPV